MADHPRRRRLSSLFGAHPQQPQLLQLWKDLLNDAGISPYNPDYLFESEDDVRAEVSVAVEHEIEDEATRRLEIAREQEEARLRKLWSDLLRESDLPIRHPGAQH
jgi:hypothetical protein